MPSPRYRMVNIVGARPNLIKIAPIMAELGCHPEFEALLVHTGQHYDESMSGVFFRELQIPQPDYNLGVGSGSHSWQTAQVMLALEPLLADLRPDLILVVGDVNSTLAAALVAAKLGIRLAHVEAGLRSFDRTMPEEVNRVLTDAVADYLFITERSAFANLQREGVPDHKIFFVGNVMVDSLLRHLTQAEALDMPRQYGLSRQGYAVLTLHRPSNVDVPAVLSGILGAVVSIQAVIPVLFPIHPRTRQRLLEGDFRRQVESMPNLRMLEPLGYLEFLGLMAQARLVLTDSGGIQEETTVLQVPCLTLRLNTERPVTITEGTNQLVGLSPSQIRDSALQVLAEGRPAGRRPELWDGRAAERIVAVLHKEAKL